MASKAMGPALNEEEAARVVLSAINDALAEMRELALRYAAKGRAIDRQMLRDMTAELERLAKDVSEAVAEGRFGEMVASAGVQGIKSVGASLSASSRQALEVALFNAEVHVKDIAVEGVKVVAETITNAMVTGKSLREISAELRERLTLNDDTGISRARADMIARNELFSAYRQGSKAGADELGYTYYRMTGPQDDRTSEICRRYLGRVMTAKEWEEIEPLVFVYGLHPNCRHAWDPVPDSVAARE